jgi:hypothetical protein
MADRIERVARNTPRLTVDTTARGNTTVLIAASAVPNATAAPITTASTRSTITNETLAHPRRRVPNYFPRFTSPPQMRPFCCVPGVFMSYRNPSSISQSARYRSPSPILYSVHSGRAAIIDVIDRPLRPQTVALTFNEFGAPHTCLVIERTPRDVGELTTELARVLARMPSASTVIVGTTCLGETGCHPLVALADEHVAFLEAREIFELQGIDLVDWFLVGDYQALSLATVTDAQRRWLLGARPD